MPPAQHRASPGLSVFRYVVGVRTRSPEWSVQLPGSVVVVVDEVEDEVDELDDVVDDEVLELVDDELDVVDDEPPPRRPSSDTALGPVPISGSPKTSSTNRVMLTCDAAGI